jgi:subtilase family serine protease
LSQATRLGSGDRITNSMPLTQQFPITVALKLRNEAQLKAINAKPHAPMSRAELTANYLPTAAQANAVKTYLQRAGFQHISVSPDHLLVRAVGNSMKVTQAFRTTMVKVQTFDGRSAYANNQAVQIPVSLQSTVAGVVGLQTVHEMHTLAQRASVHPAATPTEGVGHFTPEFADIYGAAGLPPATDIDVGVWGWGSMEQTVTDLATFLASSHGAGIVAPTAVNVVCTNVGWVLDPTGDDITGGTTTIGDPTCGGVPEDGGAVEWDMDSQSILGITGGVKTLTFYAAAVPSDNGLINSLDEIVTPSVGEPVAQVINASFGGCEKGDPTFTTAMDAGFQAAIAQGQTFSISTGDSGFDECGDGGVDSASSPANSPYVIAASGTTLRTVAGEPTWARENVWFNSGGSPSSVETAPGYQTALTYGPFAGQRGPDIAFDANPGTGAIYYNDGGLIQVGGTSLSAPLFTGAWARILEADMANTTALGFAGPNLYAVYGSDPSAFHDVTAGNNRGDDPVGGYIARPGWDWATGLGSFDVGQMAADLQN